MVDISFEIKSETVEPDAMRNVLDILFLKHLHHKINSSVATVRCQKHGGKPAVKVKGRNLDNLAYEVSGCCNDLIEETRKKLK